MRQKQFNENCGRKSLTVSSEDISTKSPAFKKATQQVKMMNHPKRGAGDDFKSVVSGI
jgi:hypothetical protein